MKFIKKKKKFSLDSHTQICFYIIKNEAATKKSLLYQSILSPISYHFKQIKLRKIELNLKAVL